MIPFVQIILAIALPSFAIWTSSRSNPVKHPYIYSIGSFVCCAWGIIAELTTIKQRLFSGDIGGIEDTIDAVILISVVMTVVVVITNLFSLGLYFEKE